MTEAASAADDSEPEVAPASGVVVGADGSDSNRHAVEWAADAAAAHGLALTIVAAAPDAEGVLVEDPEGSKALDAAVAVSRPRQPGLAVRTLQFPEPPVPSLLTAGKTAEFLVIGSRGWGGFRGLLVGSTALHVVPYAECPVVVVRPTEAAASGAVSEEAGDDRPHAGEVVLGYDGSSAANRASAFAFRHAAATGSALVVVTVQPGKSDTDLQEVHPELRPPGSDTGAFHAPIILAADSYPGVPVSFVSGTGRAADLLIREARGCRLLVIGTRGRGGFSGLVMGSVSQKLLAHAQCPIAILREEISASAAGGLS